MVYQHGSPFYDEDEESCRVMHRKASHSFPISRVYQAHIPTCSSGYWLFNLRQKISPADGSECGALESARDQDLVLYDQSS